MDGITFALIIFILYLIYQILKAWKDSRTPPPEAAKWAIGDITQHSLRFHNGMDWSKPTLIAVKGKVYDVTNSTADLYGPGKKYAVYAGRECARALAKDSLQEMDLTADLEGCTEEELLRLDRQLEHIRTVYDEVGQVVPLQQFTLEELAQHDGRDPDKPMLLAIRGVVYNITTGKDFYGPKGIYPFAGKEVARAFALISTEEKDCSDDLSDLGAMEMDNLKDWEAKFNFKYPVVGRIVGK